MNTSLPPLPACMIHFALHRHKLQSYSWLS